MQDAERWFAARQAHDDVGSALTDALRGLGDYELRGDMRRYGAPYALSAGTVFAGAAGQATAYFRLAPADRRIALASGAEAASELGPDWVQLTLFRADWPRFDLRHWALRAYAFARGSA